MCVVGLGAVGAAALAAFNRTDDKDIREHGMLVLFTAKREQYNQVAWRTLISARALGLLSLLLLITQAVLALRV